MSDHVYWKEGSLYVLDQRLLPFKTTYLKCSTLKDVAGAITDMAVRGAPLIGIVAAYGVVVGMQEKLRSRPHLKESDAEKICRVLKGTRPTAVNLFWALKKMREAYLKFKADPDLIGHLLQAAVEIHQQDTENNKRLSGYGAELIDDGDTILTHCNAGALATGGYGTALGVIRAAVKAGKSIRVIATETRPYFQGARLTAWELMQEHIPATLITDSMAGYFLSRGRINCVIVGADRIAANGDTANKIGTYSLAVLAHENAVPFYVAAPLSTVDTKIESGSDIPIEERKPDEVTTIAGHRIAPDGAVAANPAFDVTPHRYIHAIITEKGIIRKPYNFT